MTCICVLTAFRPSFPHLETLKKILENSTLSRYVKKKKIPTDRPNFQILVGWGQHNNFFFLALSPFMLGGSRIFICEWGGGGVAQKITCRRWGDKPSYLKNFKCSGEPKNRLLQHYNEWDSLLFTMPQWLYFFRLKSAIWTGQNLVS